MHNAMAPSVLEPPSSEHFVQFYEDDTFLANSVANFLGGALGAGESAMMIATAAHREAVERLLTERGVDVVAARQRGNLVSLDAATTLAEFMEGSVPNAARFVEVVGGLVRRMTEGGRRLRAFGEMVALLWAEGNKQAAIALEDLWNDLAKQRVFSLFCAYPMEKFSAEEDGNPFEHICGQHSHVIPTESYATIATDRERQLAVSKLQQRAAALEAEIERRKRVEASLAQREEELSDFLENAAEGLHKVGPDGTILWANDGELNLLGYERPEYVGHSIFEFHVDRPVIEQMLERLVHGEALVDAPARLRCKNGKIKHVLVHSSGYFRDGRFVYSRCFTRDITALREAEELQKRLLEKERIARAEAERISHMKDEFLATLSHELRTPLNAIFGWTQIIRRSPEDAQSVAEGMAVIDRNVRAQTQLIEDLLDMSRIVAGKLRLEFQQTDLAPVVEGAIEAVRPAAQAKGIQITSVLDVLSGPVSGDAGRLRQIISNLLGNAVKFTPEGGKIEVLLERVNSHAEISVTDNGPGIRPDFLPHVFEQFRQADGSIMRKHGGLGLGLSIVKQLVELHGGEVRAKSAGEGKGSSFVVLLPLAAVDQAPVAKKCAEDELNFGRDALKLQGVRVLVVDDEPDARGMVSRLLTDYDAQVEMAGSADEALAKLDVFQPHVIVSDIGMPGKDGYQLMRELREREVPGRPRVQAIALTAFARSEDRYRALRAGFQVHVSKPIESQELVVTVSSLVQRMRDGA
jgi:PAS domain S-box-containing protein